MRFNDLALYLEKLEKTASRNEITSILATLFTACQPTEIDKVVYLLSGQLAPKYKGVVFNIAERMMFQVLAKAYAKQAAEVKELFKNKGDLGEVAFAFASKQSSKSKPQNLKVTDVYSRLLEIAQDSGAKSQERKIEKMAALLSATDPLGARYLARIPVGRLRLGFSDMTILDALSVMLEGDKRARKEIERAFNVNVDIGKISQKVREKGLAGISDIKPEPGVPIRPSLAERLPSAEKILEKVGKEVAVEPKYDGFRTQVHVLCSEGKKQVVIFSRNLDNTTLMFPDLVESVKGVPVKSAIFDGEAIGYDPKRDRFLPFQETVQRKRKHGIKEASKSFPLKLFLFDILYKDGKSLLDLPFSKRRKILEDTISKIDGKLEITRQEIVSSADKIRDLIKEYLSEGLEGALIKKIDAVYKAGGRGYHWVKYKKTSEEGVADTIDCLVMGVNKGKGKRVGFGVGAFLVGVKDAKAGGKFKSVSKIGTGLTDEQWRELNSRTKKLAVKGKPEGYEVDKNLEPDTWVRPSLVVEILADEITKSPIHSAGLALRFPRLIKFRDDKSPGDTTSLTELTKLFEMSRE